MKKENKKKLKISAYIAGGLVLTLAAGTAAYVFGHKPAKVLNPCFRSCHRADGCAKKAFNSAWRANLQSLLQVVRYGEVCNAYQVGNKFYTGHSKTAFCRNINPFK